MKMRISRIRKDFGSDAFNYIEKEAGENPLDIKHPKNVNLHIKRKVLEIGLQAANKIIVIVLIK